MRKTMMMPVFGEAHSGMSLTIGSSMMVCAPLLLAIAIFYTTSTTLMIAGPGILSMANAGPNTNRRQFFLTFKDCQYLNKKHSVFGVVVEGLELLKELEKIPTDKKDKPLNTVTILDTVVVENPVQETEAAEMKRIQARAEAREGAKGKNSEKPKQLAQKQSPAVSKSQIGRYLPKVPAAASESANEEKMAIPAPAKPVAKKSKPKFGNFSGW